MYPNKAKINREGYAEACISGFSDVKKLKKFGIENQLPLLERKWDKIDLEYMTRTEIKRNKV